MIFKNSENLNDLRNQIGLKSYNDADKKDIYISEVIKRFQNEGFNVERINSGFDMLLVDNVPVYIRGTDFQLKFVDEEFFNNIMSSISHRYPYSIIQKTLLYDLYDKHSDTFSNVHEISNVIRNFLKENTIFNKLINKDAIGMLENIKSFKDWEIFENRNETDLELINRWIETSLEFPNPMLFREIRNRGLYHIINYLPRTSKEEAKAVAYSRLAKEGKVFGDDEIDKISGVISRIEFLKKKIQETSATEVVKLAELLNEMSNDVEYVKDYFKKTIIP